MPFELVTGVPLVEVLRGGSVESVHTGSVVVLGADGVVAHAVGSVATPVYPRSSNKPMQAVAMVRAGLDSAGADLALAAGSHSGEPAHIDRAEAILARSGLGVGDLLCPPDHPLDAAARDALVAAGVGRSQIFMNCSGKHASMLRTCALADWPRKTYDDPGHPLQRRIAEVVEQLSGERIAGVGVDGCGAPVLAVSLTGVARSFGALVLAEPGTPERRVADAMRAYPFEVAGTGREDTLLMRGVPGLLMKGGAEGVHAFALADGRSVALKVDDGAARARVPLLRAALTYLGVDTAGLVADDPVLGAGVPVGELAVRPGVFSA